MYINTGWTYAFATLYMIVQYILKIFYLRYGGRKSDYGKT